jgi:tetratricopeptide (TPR) repeat protein
VEAAGFSPADPDASNSPVILSDASVPHSETEAESKDPYNSEDSSDVGVPRLRSSGEAGLTPLRMTPDNSAAAAAAPAKAETTLTRTGMKLGTAGYMSPEQIRGERLDARTDIFSFGLVLYEMATGERAFTGETEAILHDAIQHRDPKPVRDVVPEISPKLDTIITKCLEKKPAQRYQSAAEVRTDLDTSGAEGSIAHKGLFNRAWRWMAGAALLAAMIGAGWAVWKVRGRLTLTSQDTIVLAAFVNNTGDAMLGEALEVPLVDGIRQSPYFRFLEPEKIRQALKSLHQPEDADLAPELARAVCRYTNSRAIIAGSITDIGNSYQIELRATDCQAEKKTNIVQERIAEREQMVRVLGDAVFRLRRNLGEPKESLLKFHRPLDVANSSSLEALQSFRLGQKAGNRGDSPQAVTHYQRAIALDPQFARAYASLGNSLIEPTLQIENITKAYQLRARVSDRVRYYIENGYYVDVTGEVDRAIEVDRKWIAEFPDEFMPHSSLSFLLNRLGYLEEARAELLTYRRLTSVLNTSSAHLMQADMVLGQLEEAKKTFAESSAHGEPGAAAREMRFQIAFYEHDHAGMQEQLSWASSRPDRPFFLALAADNERRYGHLAKARQFLREAAKASQKYPMDNYLQPWWARDALAQAEVRNITGVHTSAAEMQKFHVKETTSTRDADILLALSLSRIGEIRSAESIADRLNSEFPLDTLVQKYWLPTIRAAIQLHNGMPVKALEELKTVQYERAQVPRVPPNMYPVYLKGLAYLEAGSAEEALQAFRKMTDHPTIAGYFVTCALAHLQLARAYAMMGDKDAARKSCQDLLTLWKDADPDIPIYRQAKAEYKKLMKPPAASSIDYRHSSSVTGPITTKSDQHMAKSEILGWSWTCLRPPPIHNGSTYEALSRCVVLAAPDRPTCAEY